MAADRILGAVLAGGASSRFGSDKALAMIGGETLLARAAAVLAPFIEAVVMVGRAGGVPDVPRPGLGPLGGIAGALAHGRAQGFASVVTIACDMPEVPSELIGRLLAGTPAYCADAPVLGHWPTELAEDLADHLAAPPRSSRRDGKDGRLSVRRWAAGIGAVPIAAPHPLRNINTPADLTP